MRGSGVARDVRQRNERHRRSRRREIDKARLERPVLLDGALAGQPPVDVVVGAEHGRDAREDIRLMPLDPAQLGRDELLVDAVAGFGEERRLVDLGRELLDFRAAAPVALLDAGPQHARRDRAGRRAGSMPVTPTAAMSAAETPLVAQQLAQDRADIAPPLLGILLRPTRMAATQGRPGARRAARISSGRPIRMPIVEVVPMSRPMNVGHAAALSYPRKRVSGLAPDRNGVGFLSRERRVKRRHLSLATASMKRLTRAPSTVFQVLPSTLKWVPMTTPSAIARMSRDIVDGDAGIGEDRDVRHRFAHRFEVGAIDRLAGQRAGDQDGVGERGEHRALRARARSAAGRGNEANSALMLKRSFMSVAAEIAAQAQRAGAIGLPQAHVGGEEAGEDLAHEARAGGRGDGDAGDRVPQIVDAERDLEHAASPPERPRSSPRRLPAAP